MIRQGRQDPRLGQGWRLRTKLNQRVPSGLRSRCAASHNWSNKILGLLFALSLGGLLRADGKVSEPPPGPEALRVRISWGGGSERAWELTARIEGGRMLAPQLLGLTPETPGSAMCRGNELRVVQPLASNYGGVDVTVDGPPTALLTIDFTPVNAPHQRVERTIKLSELRAGTVTASLDENRNQFSVTRVTGDWLQLNLGREHLVFEPGERWQFGFSPHKYPGESQPLRCTAKLINARTLNPVLESKTWDLELDEYGNAPPIAWDWKVPEREGVYDLIFELEPRRYQQISFSSSPAQKLTRRVQFVVLSREPAPASDRPTEWRSLGVIDAATVGKRDWRRSFSVRTSGGFIAAGNPQVSETREVAGRKFLQLAPGQWQTFSLPVKATGKPHRVEIEYTGESDLTLGFSLLEVDPSGRIQVFGPDSGIVKRQSSVGGPVQATEGSQVVEFWPSTSQPLLLINNRHASASAGIGQIKVLAGPEQLPVTPIAAAAPPVAETALPSARRGRLAFYEFPLFPENFGAEFALDEGAGQLLTDWVTFYQGTDRLIQHLRAHGYRGAMLAVVADGSALYPSSLLGPTPRFDSGVFFSSGQDPLRKDVVELLMRMFARAGLELVPVVTLNGRLPGLEAAVRHGQADSVLLRDPTGRIPANELEVPRYNPLAPTVQQEVQRIVLELLDRYGHHPSFRGIALSCQAETCTQLPGRRWGLDLGVVNQFLASRQQPPLAKFEELYAESTQQYLFGTAREAWLGFRCGKLTAWYQELERTLRAGCPSGQLYLAGVDLYRIGDLPSLLSPSLQWPIDLPAALLDLGWDLRQLERLEHTVLMRPNRIAPVGSLVSERIELNLAGLEQTRQALSRGSYSAGLFVNRAPWSKITPPASDSQKSGNELPLLRWQPLSLSGPEARQKFAESLAHFDTRLFADGGWLLPSSASADDFFRTLAELPDVPFETVQPAAGKSLLTARQARAGDQWYAYLVNPSPWPLQTEVVVDTPPATPLRVIPDTVPTERLDGSSQTRLRFQIEPFGLIVLSSSAAQPLAVSDFSAAAAETVGEALRTRLRRLQEQLVSASTPRAWNVLRNPDFNLANADDPGWRFDPRQEDLIKIESDPLRQDNAALHLQSQNETVWIRSNELPVPETGRLSISVWLRLDPNQPQPPLRIAIEADSETPEYYRFARVGNLTEEEPGSETISTEWKQFIVHFDDLPIHTAERCRIGFDLMGAGSIWIDRVEIFDRWFDQNDTKALTQLLAAAGPLLRDQAGWNEGRLLLDSYWLRFLDQYGSPDPAPQPLEPATTVSTEEEASSNPFQLRRSRRADKPRMVPFR